MLDTRQLCPLPHHRGFGRVDQGRFNVLFGPGGLGFCGATSRACECECFKFVRRPRMELFNFAESDLGERLRARGIEDWGRPMNGAFR